MDEPVKLMLRHIKHELTRSQQFQLLHELYLHVTHECRTKNEGCNGCRDCKPE